MGISPEITCQEMEKAEACCQPKKELVPYISHSSDNFPDCLAGKTGAGTVMGQ